MFTPAYYNGDVESHPGPTTDKITMPEAKELEIVNEERLGAILMGELNVKLL